MSKSVYISIFEHTFDTFRKDRKTQGIDRPAAAALVERMKTLLSPELQQSIGAFILFGGRSENVRVPIKPHHIIEVSNIWVDHLSLDENKYGDKDLFIVRQRPPEEQKRYETCGRLEACTKSEIDTLLETKVFWKPDFAAPCDLEDVLKSAPHMVKRRPWLLSHVLRAENSSAHITPITFTTPRYVMCIDDIDNNIGM